MDPQLIEKLIGIKRANEQILMGKPNVVGVDVGLST